MIDVIIVNYNGMEYLPACLETLFASRYPAFQVIVVDNCSTDGSVRWIKEHYPMVTVIENAANEGFGKANVKGIRHGNAPCFALLNNDTKVDKEWLVRLAEVMENDPDCAAACSRLLFMDHPEVINAAGGGMNVLGYGYDHGIFSIARRSPHEIKNVLFPTAAACLIRRFAFDDVQGFDPSFFMYHEDVDLGWRFNLRGYTVKYVPESTVYHAFGGTSMKSGSMQFRNRLGLRHALRSLLKNYETETLKDVLPLFCRININNFRAGIATGFFRALLWNLVRLPDTVVHRCRVQRHRKMSDQNLSSLIWQDTHMPVQFPDYRAYNRNSFESEYAPEDEVHFIDNTTCHLGYGWYPCECYPGDNTTLYRWTREEALFFFRYSGKNALLSLKVLGLPELLGMKRTFTVQLMEHVEHSSLKTSLKHYKTSLKHYKTSLKYYKTSLKYYKTSLKHYFTIESDLWEYFNIPLSGEAGIVEVKLSVDETWSPHDKFNNRDYRHLGIGVAEALIVMQ